MYRSCEMSFCNIYIQEEAAFKIITSLGHMDCVEFLDANVDVPPLERRYTPELCRCAEMENKLRRIQREMEKDNILLFPASNTPVPLQHNEMILFENTLEDWDSDLDEMAANHVTLMKSYLQLNEMYYVLESLGPIFGVTELLKDQQFIKFTGLMSAEAAESGRLVVLTGVVRRARCYTFETMLWRISHSNIFYKVSNDDKILKDPFTGQDIRKVAFIVVVQGEQLSNRILKICEGFKATLYNCPRTLDGRENMKSMLEIRISDIEIVLRKTNFHRCKALRNVGRTWMDWMNSVKMTKAVFHHMNLFSVDITKKCLIGNCWIPTQELKSVQEKMKECTRRSAATVNSFIFVVSPCKDVPPTYYKTNKFTKGFQSLINAYGDSAYGEVNPALYSIITFPFLFAMMFGDVGHGLIITLFATWMCINEKKIECERSTNEIWNIFFTGRYIILLMGFFSIFTGFVYNDFFAKSVSFTASAWKNKYSKSDIFAENNKFMFMDAYGKGQTPTKYPPSTYWFGVDPVWQVAKNMMIFQNSIKMKISMVVGVVHMIFGIFMSLLNHLHFKHTHAIFLEFLPQLIFLCCLFLYLVFMMFYKWITFSMYSDETITREGCAPLLLIYFIDMVLMRTTNPIAPSCEAYMYPGQAIVQKILLILALICVPIMLCGSPCWEGRKNKNKRKKLTKQHIDSLLGSPTKSRRKMFRSYRIDESSILVRDRSSHKFHKVQRDYEDLSDERKREELLEKYPLFSDLIITQSVHTIEFVLSTVSHTASYLRLWALSLAHSQLSEMLWKMILQSLGMYDQRIVGSIKLYVAFAIWATFTLCVLVIMEGLSAFLHTLRLHWVEFMSKFFIGGGYSFKPFSFETILYGDYEDLSSSVCAKAGRSRERNTE